MHSIPYVSNRYPLTTNESHVGYAPHTESLCSAKSYRCHTLFWTSHLRDCRTLTLVPAAL